MYVCLAHSCHGGDGCTWRMAASYPMSAMVLQVFFRSLQLHAAYDACICRLPVGTPCAQSSPVSSAMPQPQRANFLNIQQQIPSRYSQCHYVFSHHLHYVTAGTPRRGARCGCVADSVSEPSQAALIRRCARLHLSKE